MTLDEYQNRALKLAVYPDRGRNLTYPIVGLVGEAGELANTWKKAMRGDDAGPLARNARRLKLAKELQGVLWYVAAVADELGLSLSDVAVSNLADLEGRAARGTIKGTGDDR